MRISIKNLVILCKNQVTNMRDAVAELFVHCTKWAPQLTGLSLAHHGCQGRHIHQRNSNNSA